MMDKRIYDVLDAIVNHPAITGVELETTFNLTRKQLSYTIQKINDYLQSRHFDPITRQKTGRLCIPKQVIDTFRHQQQLSVIQRYIYSEDERGQLIIFLLLTRLERLSLLHLSSSLMVSQNTIINDIKKIHVILEGYQLCVHYAREYGYRIIGTEIAKRHLLLETTRQTLQMPIGQQVITTLRGEITTRLQQTGKVFSEIEKQLNILFTDSQLQELTYYICFILQRIEQGKIIKSLPENYLGVAQSRDFLLMQKLIEKFGIIDRHEQIFLTTLVQSSNIQTIADKYFHLDTVLLKSVIQVIDCFEQISFITFKDKHELIKRIYQHWRPAYYRIRYHITNTNSVYEMVLQEFSHIHEMVRRSIFPFESLVYGRIPDEEIAFLTLLFGGWLTREGMINQLKIKKAAVVVCENSATLSAYLYFTLQVLLPELHFTAVISKREYEKYDDCHDVVFSTCSLNTNDKLLFVVNPTFTGLHKTVFRNQVIGALQGVDPNIIQVEELLYIISKHATITDKKGLQKALTHYIYQEEHLNYDANFQQVEDFCLADLLPESHIYLVDVMPESWEEAIRQAAVPLIQDQIIEHRYLQAILNKIRIDQPYIELIEGVIIAHADMDNGVKQIGMSLLRLPDKINIGGYMQADIIVVLATNNSQKHLKALAQLNEFLEFDNGAMFIRQVKNCYEIREQLLNYQ